MTINPETNMHLDQLRYQVMHAPDPVELLVATVDLALFIGGTIGAGAARGEGNEAEIDQLMADALTTVSTLASLRMAQLAKEADHVRN